MWRNNWPGQLPERYVVVTGTATCAPQIPDEVSCVTLSDGASLMRQAWWPSG
jgi:hypothetical protein